MNQLVINNFEKLIQETENIIAYLKIEGEHADELENLNFKLNHLKKTIIAIKSYPYKIITGEQLRSIKGIGKKTIEKVNYILTYGRYEAEYDSKLIKKANQYHIDNLKQDQKLKSTEVVEENKTTAKDLIKKYPCAIKSNSTSNTIKTESVEPDGTNENNVITQEQTESSANVESSNISIEINDNESIIHGCLENTFKSFENLKTMFCNYQTDVTNFWKFS
jgi:hypothetical protein